MSHQTFNQRICRILLGISSLSIIFGGQAVQAETTKIFNSASELTEEFKQNESEETSAVLAQTRQQRQRRGSIKPTAPSYLGIGGSLGLVENAFGDFGAFAVTSKLRLFSIIDSQKGGTDASLRPSVIIGKDVAFAVPFTLDLRLPPFKNTDTTAVVPYFGPGFVATTGDNSEFKFLMAAGLDVPVGRFTTNAQLNIGFLEKTAVGLTLSVGYNF